MKGNTFICSKVNKIELYERETQFNKLLYLLLEQATGVWAGWVHNKNLTPLDLTLQPSVK